MARNPAKDATNPRGEGPHNPIYSCAAVAACAALMRFGGNCSCYSRTGQQLSGEVDWKVVIKRKFDVGVASYASCRPHQPAKGQPRARGLNMTKVELATVGIAAIIAGAVSALAGGGTLITFPTLLAVGVPAVPANVTNTVALCSGYLGGTLAELKELSGEKQKILAFGVASALGGFVGGVLLLTTGEATFRALVPYLILFAAALLVVEEPVHRWHERRIGRSGQQHMNRLWQLIPVFLASVYGRYFGGGLATIVLAVLALEVHESITKLNALKQMISLCTNVAAAVLFLFSNQVVWSAAIVMAVGALFGGVIGGFAADRIRPSVLRGIVVVFAVAIAVAYFVR
jgi:hypothetical protein